MDGLEKAIERAGSLSALARLISTSHQNVSIWRKRGKVSAPFCRAISEATGVDLAELRPDLYEGLAKK